MKRAIAQTADSPSPELIPLANESERGKIESSRTAANRALQLASLATVIALKLLNHKGKLDALTGNRSGHGDLTLSNTPLLSARLHERFSRFCPPSILRSLPDPSSKPAFLKDSFVALAGREFSALWQDDCNLGFAYQYFCAAQRTEAQKNLQRANKALNVKELAAFTQLYTPAWVVDFLISNAVLPLWRHPANAPGTEQTIRSQQSKQIQNQDLPAQLDRFDLLNESNRLEPVDHLNELQQFERWRLRRTLPDTESLSSAEPALSAKQLTILDPACGAGNFLFRAFDLVSAAYIAEGASVSESIRDTVSHNLTGADIDAEALWIAALGLFVKCLLKDAREPGVTANLWHVQSSGQSSLLGSLSREFKTELDHPLGEKLYAAVVTNPPYLGRKLLSRELKQALKENYPGCHHDLCTAFLAHALEHLLPGGRLGFITQSSMLSLPSYAELRRKLIEEHTLISTIEAGSGVFPLQGGDKVSSVLLVAAWGADQHAPLTVPHKTSGGKTSGGKTSGGKTSGGKTSERQRFASAPDPVGKEVAFTQLDPGNQSTTLFADLTKEKNKGAALQKMIDAFRTGSPNGYKLRNARTFNDTNKFAFNFTCPPSVTKVLSDLETLSTVADVRQGLATTDNQRFVRFLWDVELDSIGHKWFPYVKGAGATRWHSPLKYVVNWQNDGAEIKEAVSAAYPYLKNKVGWVVKNEEFYFRPGLSFSFVSTKDLAVRRMPKGCIFDVGGSAVFAGEINEDLLLAYLNSSLVSAAARSLNPTVNFQVGDLRKLPMLTLSASTEKRLSEIARQCEELVADLMAFEDATIIMNEAALAEALSDTDRWLDAFTESESQKLADLRQLEEENDRLVLTAFVSSNPTLDQREVLEWIRAVTVERGAILKRRSLPDLSDTLAVRVFQRLLAPSGTEAGSARNSSITSSSCYLLPLAAPLLGECLAHLMELPAHNARSIGSLLISNSNGQELCSRMSAAFERFFAGSPPFFCAHVGTESQPMALIASSSFLRRYMSDKKIFKQSLQESQTLWQKTGLTRQNSVDRSVVEADEILEHLSRDLGSSQDWTGRLVSQSLKNRLRARKGRAP